MWPGAASQSLVPVLYYQPREGVLGFDIETKDELFWAPIAHRTRKYSKASPIRYKNYIRTAAPIEWCVIK